MKAIYPVLFYEEKENGYSVFVPDLNNVSTCGDTLEEAMINAKDVLEGTLFVYIKNNQPLPDTDFDAEKLSDNARLAYADVWVEPLVEKARNLSVKKNLTIPKWLNDASEKQGINFSNVLQTALKKELGIPINN